MATGWHVSVGLHFLSWPMKSAQLETLETHTHTHKSSLSEVSALFSLCSFRARLQLLLPEPPCCPTVHLSCWTHSHLRASALKGV